MRNRVALATLGVGLLLAGVAIDRHLLLPLTPAESPSRFLVTFDGLATVFRHLNGVGSAPISQLVGGNLRTEQGVSTRSHHVYCSCDKPLKYDDIKGAMEKIGGDIAAQVAAEGGTTTCNCLGWNLEPSEWVYEIGDRRGVVTVLVLPLNRPTPTDLQANLAVVVQVAEF